VKPNFEIWVVLLCLTLFFMGCTVQATACGNNSTGIVISDAWARPTTGQTGDIGSSAAYMVLTNCSKEPDRLLKVESEAAEFVEVHKSETQNGMMVMDPISNIDLPAGQQVTLKPGDLHIMMMNLKQNLTIGQTVQLKLTFEKNGLVTIMAPIKNQ
jgi:copper(I)-binding protein